MPFAARAGRPSWGTRCTLRLAGAFALFLLAFAGGWQATSVATAVPGAATVTSAGATAGGGIMLVPAGTPDAAAATAPGSGIDLVRADSGVAPAPVLTGDDLDALPGSGPALAALLLLIAALAQRRRTPLCLTPRGPRSGRAPPLRLA